MYSSYINRYFCLFKLIYETENNFFNTDFILPII